MEAMEHAEGGGRENTTIARETRMETDAARSLKQLIEKERVAALATLRDAAPLASMTLFLAAADFSAFYIHVSRLAWHTQDILKDPRVSLLMNDADDGRDDPLTLRRVTVRANAGQIANDAAEFGFLKSAWLGRFPMQSVNFGLADFNFWRLSPTDARFVAGYGRIMKLSATDLVAAAGA